MELDGTVDVHMEGYLSRLSGLRSVQKERYFRLRVESGVPVLEKLKDKYDTVVRDSYAIHPDTEVKFSERTGAYWFAIKSKTLNTKFGAKTSLERVQWIKAIQKCVSGVGEEGKKWHADDSLVEDEDEIHRQQHESQSRQIKIEVDSLAHEMRSKRGVKKKTHYVEYENIKNSFKGSEVSRWLIKNRFCNENARAIEVGHELLKRGKISRVDGKRTFTGQSEVYIFNEALGMTTSGLMRDIDSLTSRLQNLQLEIHQVENSSEELYDLLQNQLSLLKNETHGMRQQIEWLSGITLSISLSVVVLGLWGNFSDVPIMIRVFVLLLMLASTFLGLVLMSANKDPSVVLRRLSQRFESVRVRHHGLVQSQLKGVDPTPRESLSANRNAAASTPSRIKTAKAPTAATAKSPTESAHGAERVLDKSKGPKKPNLKIDTKKTSSNSTLASASADSKEDADWKTAGKGIIFRHFTETDPKDCWSQPDSKTFKVRGPGYMTDGIKVLSKESRFETVVCEMCSVGEKVDHIAGYKHSAIHRLRREYKYPKDAHPFPINFLIIQFQLPGISFTMYMQARANQKPDTEISSGFTRMFNMFVDGDNDYRNSRFKILPTVKVGNWIVRKMVGAKPALLGQKIACCYSRGPDYLEIDVDIASSYVAQKILGVVQGYCKTLQVDLGFFIEGRCVEELPECVLGAVRFHHVDLGAIPPLGPLVPNES
eukprot:CAMPEP_0197526726 /NCGR_PEP_ID=MMETSP1318-20131121/19110_1 /TAXON_ID=552666 /ORGANISM="Partenskyella glossopodia, Strain RCC365" /LENGTH=710 /DNA_ID=CAMNT_0043081037 /DNA_START=346 /DNA_END=2478 /DNA_ORIENTATION=+